MYRRDGLMSFQFALAKPSGSVLSLDQGVGPRGRALPVSLCCVIEQNSLSSALYLYLYSTQKKSRH